MKKKTIYKTDVDNIVVGMDSEEVSWVHFLADETNTGYDSLDRTLTVGTFYSSFPEASTAAKAIVVYYTIKRVQPDNSARLIDVVRSVADKLGISHRNTERTLRSISRQTYFGCLILVSAEFGHHVIKLWNVAEIGEDVLEHILMFGSSGNTAYICDS